MSNSQYALKIFYSKNTGCLPPGYNCNITIEYRLPSSTTWTVDSTVSNCGVSCQNVNAPTACEPDVFSGIIYTGTRALPVGVIVRLKYNNLPISCYSNEFVYDPVCFGTCKLIGNDGEGAFTVTGGYRDCFDIYHLFSLPFAHSMIVCAGVTSAIYPGTPWITASGGLSISDVCCGTGSCNKSKPINIVQGIATDCCDCDD